MSSFCHSLYPFIVGSSWWIPCDGDVRDGVHVGRARLLLRSVQFIVALSLQTRRFSYQANCPPECFYYSNSRVRYPKYSTTYPVYDWSYMNFGHI